MSNVKENAKGTDKNIVHMNTWDSAWQIASVYWLLAVIIYNV